MDLGCGSRFGGFVSQFVSLKVVVWGFVFGVFLVVFFAKIIVASGYGRIQVVIMMDLCCEINFY